jgi:hypothetical protein
MVMETQWRRLAGIVVLHGVSMQALFISIVFNRLTTTFSVHFFPLVHDEDKGGLYF